MLVSVLLLRISLCKLIPFGPGSGYTMCFLNKIQETFFCFIGSFRQCEECPNNKKVAAYFECKTYTQKDIPYIDMNGYCTCMFTHSTSTHEFINPAYIPANWDTEGAEIY